MAWFLEIALIVAIIASVVAVALETVPGIFARYGTEFHNFDLLITAIFTVEYAARVWASAEAAPDQPAWRVRLRYVLTPMAVIDLIAILPLYLTLFFSVDFQLLRVLRLLRIYKLTRYSPALSALIAVIREEGSTLLAAFMILAILLVFASAGAYLVEHQAQPEAFGSVPSSMWWAMVTLTTVGYGDVTPITPLGRLFGGAITLLGVGMAALPAGIIASGMADHLHQRRKQLHEEFRCALEDGFIDITEGRKIERLRRELGINREMARTIHQEVRRNHRDPKWCRCPSCGHKFESRP
ncbi:ion transporter [Leisingera sp.]|uniref:ion transporter n=1 Tax=Leisingera sp. TaxID=1879318 RepID=UPI002B26E4CF|nr:ion transporter [Leisingera sp.]